MLVCLCAPQVQCTEMVRIIAPSCGLWLLDKLEFAHFSLQNNSTVIKIIPSTINTTEKANSNVKSISIIVDKNLPSLVSQEVTRLLPAIKTIAKVQMLPIRERNPPITALFIQSHSLSDSSLSLSFYHAEQETASLGGLAVSVNLPRHRHKGFSAAALARSARLP